MSLVAAFFMIRKCFCTAGVAKPDDDDDEFWFAWSILSVDASSNRPRNTWGFTMLLPIDSMNCSYLALFGVSCLGGCQFRWIVVV
jgi:hypothetical protein